MQPRTATRTAVQLEIAFYTIMQTNWEVWEEDAWDEYIERVETGQTSVTFPA